ncbi:acetyl-CoA synthetase-like protein [Ramicandelaber brevisporus]|nr:acetyl-CoA synthetase-like protein [Ramicandelaber brevisporus]
MPAENLFSFEVPSAQSVPGEGKPRMHIWHKFNPDTPLALPGNISNLHDVFLAGKAASKSGNFLGKRLVVNAATGELSPNYTWFSYEQCYERFRNLGSGLKKLGLQFGDSLGFYSKNNIECYLARETCNMYGFVMVPLYDTLGPEAVEHIVGEAEVRNVFTTSDKFAGLVAINAKIPAVKRIVLMDNNETGIVTEADLAAAAAAGIQVLDMSAIEALGGSGRIEKPDRAPTAQDLALLCYTSGSVGNPKGALIKVGNFLGYLASANMLCSTGRLYNTTSEDRTLAYLPLAHIMEQGLSYLSIYKGASMGVYCGDTTRILEDLAALKPTVFIGVPRIFARIYDRVWGTVRAKGGLALRMFEHAYETKKAALHTTGETRHWLWDRLVFKTIRNLLGGSIRFLLSGSAPLSLEVLDFLRITTGADVVVEGYGMTETSCSASVSQAGDVEAGHVGAPMPGLEMKLIDIPEMNYFSTDKPYPRGEICMRGPNIFSGYYRNAEKTAEALDKDGWLHTGDVGMWDNKGRLRIIDRVKNLLKLSQGEYVAPERLENIYFTHPVVAQSFVYGDSYQSFLVGIVVPDEEALRAFVAEKIPALKSAAAKMSFQQLCESAQVRTTLVKDLDELRVKKGLMGFESLKDIHLAADPFSPENGILTPTLKLKRNVARDVYKKEIDAMYAATIARANAGQNGPKAKL